MKNLLIAATLITTPITANANELGPAGIADKLYSIFKSQKMEESARLMECDPDLVERTAKRVDQQLQDLREMVKQ